MVILLHWFLLNIRSRGGGLEFYQIGNWRLSRNPVPTGRQGWESGASFVDKRSTVLDERRPARSNFRDSQTFGMRVEIKLLDVGGEGRNANAWNLNPRSLKTLGPEKGYQIKRLIVGKAECIPLPDQSVHQIIMERAPLRRVAVFEMVRVLVPGGSITLRHDASVGRNPHEFAQQLLSEKFSVQPIKIGRQVLQETRFANVHQIGNRAIVSSHDSLVFGTV